MPPANDTRRASLNRRSIAEISYLMALPLESMMRVAEFMDEDRQPIVKEVVSKTS